MRNASALQKMSLYTEKVSNLLLCNLYWGLSLTSPNLPGCFRAVGGAIQSPQTTHGALARISDSAGLGQIWTHLQAEFPDLPSRSQSRLPAGHFVGDVVDVAIPPSTSH